jgi:elongation factor G
MESGIIEGFPLVDVKVTLYDGSYHDVDSNETAFRFAGSIAFREAARKAHPIVLEPMMAIKVEVPENLAAATLREIRTYRGRIERESVVNGFVQVEAVLPLSVVLASTPSGLALFPMEFACYEAVRDRDTPSEDGPFAPVKKPSSPWPGSRSGMVRPPEEE